MRTTLLLMLLCLSLSQNSFAQRGLFWLGGFELGGNTGGYSFKQNENILSNGFSDDGDGDSDGKRFGYHHSINTSLYYRFSRRVGIEAGLMKTFMDIPLHDVRYQGVHKASDGADNNAEGNFDPTFTYNAKYVAAHFYLKDVYGLGIQTYFGGGVAFNNLSGSPSVTKSYFDKTLNENLVLNGHYTQSFYSPFIETGFFFFSPHQKFRSFLSLKYYFAPSLFSGDYQSTQNNNVLYQDHVTQYGSSFTLSYKCGLSLTKPKEQVYAHHYSTRHYKKIGSAWTGLKHKTEHDVLKARLLGCYGYDKYSKASFWLFENKNRYFLEKLDSNVNRVFVEELNLKSDESGLGKHDWVYIKNMTVKDKITLITSSGNAESTYIKITAHQFALNGRENRLSLPIFRLKGDERKYIHIAWSADSSKFSVAIFQPKSKQTPTNKFFIKTLDRNLTLLNEASLDFPVSENDADAMYLTEESLDNQGNLTMVAEQYGKKSGRKNPSIWMYDPRSKKIMQLQFEVNNISSLVLKKNEQGETSVLGFYNDDAGKNSEALPYKGIFYGKVNPTQMSIDKVKSYELPKNTEEPISRKRLHYKFVSAINHKNGSILNAEGLSLTGPHTFLLASLDKDGNVKSISSIKKDQNYSIGYFPFFNERTQTLNLIFNERKKNLLKDESIEQSRKVEQMDKKRKTVPVLVTIDALGNQTEKLLLPNDKSKNRWIPHLSFQMNDQILLVGKTAGKYQRIKAKE